MAFSLCSGDVLTDNNDSYPQLNIVYTRVEVSKDIDLQQALVLSAFSILLYA